MGVDSNGYGGKTVGRGTGEPKAPMEERKRGRGSGGQCVNHHGLEGRKRKGGPEMEGEGWRAGENKTTKLDEI